MEGGHGTPLVEDASMIQQSASGTPPGEKTNLSTPVNEELSAFETMHFRFGAQWLRLLEKCEKKEKQYRDFLSLLEEEQRRIDALTFDWSDILEEEPAPPPVAAAPERPVKPVKPTELQGNRTTTAPRSFLSFARRKATTRADCRQLDNEAGTPGDNNDEQNTQSTQPTPPTSTTEQPNTSVNKADQSNESLKGVYRKAGGFLAKQNSPLFSTHRLYHSLGIEVQSVKLREEEMIKEFDALLDSVKLILFHYACWRFTDGALVPPRNAKKECVPELEYAVRKFSAEIASNEGIQSVYMMCAEDITGLVTRLKKAGQLYNKLVHGQLHVRKNIINLKANWKGLRVEVTDEAVSDVEMGVKLNDISSQLQGIKRLFNNNTVISNELRQCTRDVSMIASNIKMKLQSLTAPAVSRNHTITNYNSNNNGTINATNTTNNNNNSNQQYHPMHNNNSVSSGQYINAAGTASNSIPIPIPYPSSNSFTPLVNELANMMYTSSAPTSAPINNVVGEHRSKSYRAPSQRPRRSNSATNLKDKQKKEKSRRSKRKKNKDGSNHNSSSSSSSSATPDTLVISPPTSLSSSSSSIPLTGQGGAGGTVFNTEGDLDEVYYNMNPLVDDPAFDQLPPLYSPSSSLPSSSSSSAAALTSPKRQTRRALRRTRAETNSNNYSNNNNNNNDNGFPIFEYDRPHIFIPTEADSRVYYWLQQMGCLRAYDLFLKEGVVFENIPLLTEYKLLSMGVEHSAIRKTILSFIHRGLAGHRVLKKGWMVKKGDRVRNWKLRFFILLSCGELRYFNSEHNPKPKGIVDLSHEAIIYAPSQDKSAKDFAMDIITPGRTYVFCCGAQREFDEWILHLKAAIRHGVGIGGGGSGDSGGSGNSNGVVGVNGE